MADIDLTGAVHKALTTRDALTKRLKKSRPIVRVHIVELDDEDDPDEPEAWLLFRAMSGTHKEDWQWRRIAEEQYEPDDAIAKAHDRQKTWGEILKGNKPSLVAESVVDENGRVLYSQAALDELNEGNSAAIERMYAKAVQLNGLPRAGIPDHLLKWLEEDETGARPEVLAPGDVAKNSLSGRTKASSSSLPEPPAAATS